ncbi:MAG TPA: T9SS type A sorting domain-containing protein, partial [Bacteroidales bacterium]|nr:T9SS type A sorting domain-containing protein [Bacteroidales bacterium]
GSYRAGWPVAVPENYWTYSPPTVVDLNGDGNYSIFMSRPTGEDAAPMLYGFNPDGSMMDNFPITKSGGLEGFISVADIDADGEHELIFGSNLMIEGMGFIHAYKMDGSGELEGFPLRPTGFTFMNGANLGDIDGDGLVDLVALSYEQNFSPTDSVFINAYRLEVDIETANILAGTYKGSNDHSGHITMPEAYASILVDPEEITQSWSGNEIYCSDLSISNTGDAELEFDIETNYLRDNWITVNPTSASILPGESLLVEVCLDATELQNGMYQAELLVNSNDPVNPQLIIPVNLFITVGTVEMNSKKLTVYPNPTKGIIQLKLEENASILKLYNLQGQLLDEINMEEKSELQLDLQPYQQNALMLEVKYQNGALARQLIVIN